MGYNLDIKGIILGRYTRNTIHWELGTLWDSSGCGKELKSLPAGNGGATLKITTSYRLPRSLGSFKTHGFY